MSTVYLFFFVSHNVFSPVNSLVTFDFTVIISNSATAPNQVMSHLFWVTVSAVHGGPTTLPGSHSGGSLRRCDHITDALISLHWLRVPERITFKVATLTYHALHGSAPPYLASSFTCVADMPHRRRLRSASTEQLDVLTCRRSTIGGRAFPVAGANVWNGLPSDVTSASSLSVFKNRLKTYLFRRCYETVWLSITFPSFPSHYLPPQNSGPCNGFYCLGHFKNVYDDDDDDDDDE